MAIRTVGVIGTGVIGSSWAGLFLAHGLRVLVSDPAPDARNKLQSYLESIWPTLQGVGLKSGASLSNYEFVGASMDEHYDELDFVQENAPERSDLKTKLLGEIDAGTRPDVTIASSSSGIPSSQFVALCKTAPERVLIGHPFNPPHLMPLVEVVPHSGTSNKSIESALAFYRLLGRKPIVLHQEIPGFAANRLQAALCNEAYSLVSRGILSAKDLDTCVTTSLGPRWAVTGPLMSNAMGGGGGSDGFKHLLEHLGPATEKWVADMKAHAFTWSPAQLSTLADSVEEEIGLLDVHELERKRDATLVELFSLQDKAETK